MFLVEAVIALSILMILLSVGLLLLKFVFAVVLVPLKIALFLTKGLLGLLVLLPMLLIVGTIITAILPVGILLLALPVLILGGVVCGLVGV